MYDLLNKDHLVKRALTDLQVLTIIKRNCGEYLPQINKHTKQIDNLYTIAESCSIGRSDIVYVRKGDILLPRYKKPSNVE